MRLKMMGCALLILCCGIGAVAASDELENEVRTAVTGPALQFRRAQHGGKTVEIIDTQLL